jgi:CBS domain-containing protein
MNAADSLEPEIEVKDIMISPVITVKQDDSLKKVAELMSEHNLGSVVVIDEEGKPVGIITERDAVKRVMAKDLIPSKVKAKEVMSSPLILVKPDTKISEAAEKMRRHEIRRLIVMDRGKMIGIVSSKDIVAIMPELIEIISERAKISMETGTAGGLGSSSVAGYCEICEAWSDNLNEADGKLICEDCKVELESEE